MRRLVLLLRVWKGAGSNQTNRPVSLSNWVILLHLTQQFPVTKWKLFYFAFCFAFSDKLIDLGTATRPAEFKYSRLKIYNRSHAACQGCCRKMEMFKRCFLKGGIIECRKMFTLCLKGIFKYCYIRQHSIKHDASWLLKHWLVSEGLWFNLSSCLQPETLMVCLLPSPSFLCPPSLSTSSPSCSSIL